MDNPHAINRAPRVRVSLMVWGCMCFAGPGVGTLMHVEGNINA